MALSKPGGRFDGPVSEKPGSETKARSGSSYQPGVSVGFGIGSGQNLDSIPVSPASPVMVSKESMPSTEMGGIGDVNTESR